jgi:hypothetical protein
MKTYKHKALLILAVTIGAGILSVGNGCSKSFSSSPSTDSGGSNGANSIDNSEMPIIPGARTVSIVYSKQVVDQLTSCVGVQTPSAATMNMYSQKQGAISTYGTANTVTAPMMMAVTSIAGEICNDLINQEVASGARMFMGFDMKANVLPNSSQLEDAVTRLSLSCWQRMETSDEKLALVNLVTTSVGATEASATRKAALMLCTSMLSSLDALLN